MMNPLIKLKYIKELKGHLKQDLLGLPVLEKLATIKRMRELIQLLGGNAASVKEEISKAQNATQLADLMQKAIDESKDIPNAFKRDDMEVSIDIKVGDETKGLLHILKRREQEGTLSIITRKELFEAIAYTIVNGQKGPLQDRVKSYPRQPIRQGGSTVILVMDPKTNAWILTGWVIDNKTLKKLRELPPDARRSVLLTDTATPVSSLVPDPNGGAGGLGFNSTDDGSINQESDVEFLQQVIQGKVEPTDRAMSRMNVIIHNTESTDEEKKLQDKALDVWFKALVSFVVGEEEEIE